MCANNYETAFSFMNLGVACLYLGEYEAAEKVLKKANILDTQNANVWGYLSLVMLRNGSRVFNAFQSLKEAMRLNVKDHELLLDIGKEFIINEDEITARKVLEFGLLVRAGNQKQSGAQKKKVQEFLLQIGKVL